MNAQAIQWFEEAAGLRSWLDQIEASPEVLYRRHGRRTDTTNLIRGIRVESISGDAVFSTGVAVKFFLEEQDTGNAVPFPGRSFAANRRAECTRGARQRVMA